MKFLVKCQFALAITLLSILAGCGQSSEEIKAKAEKATREAKQDVKAAAQGVRDGLKSDKDKKDDKDSKKESPRKQ